MGERDRELKEFKQGMTKEFQSLAEWAEKHLTIKDVKFASKKDDSNSDYEDPPSIFSSKISKAIKEYKTLLKKQETQIKSRFSKLRERNDSLEAEIKKL